MSRATVGIVAVLLAMPLASCSDADDLNSAELNGELLVSAAASLTDVFAEMELAFENAFPDVDVVLNLAGSSALREQILEGAPPTFLPLPTYPS